MGLRCGIVGLPNVGKSTLFNALTSSATAAAENYAFCTVEPNVGEVPVPDERLETIAKLAGSVQVIPTRLGFVDIAGLVRGASKGEGLGNRFLAHIREMDAIIHVLRCFGSGEVMHVEGRIDPIADAETVDTELMLADLESLTGRIHGLERRIRGGDTEAAKTLDLVRRAIALLEEGRPAREMRPADPEETRRFRELQLLTAKPVLYLCNVEEAAVAAGNAETSRVAEKAAGEGAGVVIVSAAIEAEIAEMDDPADKREFLASIGLERTGLDRLIRAAYELLDLITFFTAGPKEARAWTIPRGTKAPQAAGVIHSDFEDGFIRAETTAYEDFVACGGESGARAAGKMRLEGKDYIVRDGDVLHIRFAT